MSLHRSERHAALDAPDTTPGVRIYAGCRGGSCAQGDRQCSTPQACWLAEPVSMRDELVSFWEELVSLVFFWRK